MSTDKSMLDRFMAVPRKELVDDVIFYHDGWIAAGREYNKLKAENEKLREYAAYLLDFIDPAAHQSGCNRSCPAYKKSRRASELTKQPQRIHGMQHDTR